jgi:GTP cyclohydrolase I
MRNRGETLRLDRPNLFPVPPNPMARRATSGSVERARRTPDRTGAEAAIRALITALGLDPDDPALADTPERTAGAYLDLLAAGYRTTPAEALGKGFPVSSSDPVVATRLPVMFLCPHHLMPARGEVHLAFVPKDRVPGLARIARLVDALAHRLVLQEDLGRWIVRALAEHLEVEAAVAIVDARHTCVAIEDFARSDTAFRTRATHGKRKLVASLEAEIDASLASAWATSASEPPTRKRASKSRSR